MPRLVHLAAPEHDREVRGPGDLARIDGVTVTSVVGGGPDDIDAFAKARGIGHATVKRFSREGWRVITCSRQAFAEDCPWPAGPEDHIQLDLSDQEGVGIAIAEIRHRIEAEGGQLNALVNNAAISPKSGDGKRLNSIETPMHVWRDVFQVNFFAPIMLARGLFKELAAAKGSVVNVTSIVGSRVHPFAGSAYATSKAALTALTRELAADLAHLGVRVNAVCPGEINTAILSPGTDKLVERIPLRRLGSPEEVAAVIYYLASDQASYITGAEIPVNGGQDLY